MNENQAKNPAAVALGRLGAGKPKTLTPEQREALRQNMLKIRKPAPRKTPEGPAEAPAVK